MIRPWPRLLFAALALVLAAGAWADVPVPPLQARVTDLTGTLTADQRAKLDGELKAFEAKKGSQIAVLLVPTTEPETIEQYSIRVAEAWKLGRKGVDDGVLLLVAKDDHTLRIEVGYGLEGVIPDAVANRVVEDIIVPHFKQGDFYGGIEAGVDRLIRLVEGEPLPPPKQKGSSGSVLDKYFPAIFIAVIIGGGLLRAIFGPFFGASIAGGITGVVGWLLFGTLLGGLAAAVVVFFFVLAGVSGMGGGGGFSSGGGGGFSGGGGGFGGGGASGRW